MQIAAALLAGGAVFFAGFILGLYPPARPRPAKVRAANTERDSFFEKFLNYNGEMMP
ncbi:MAG: hypothetical protein J5852_09150 [Clostridia bacterium]|nr:hypothetical protein [Clostridia bacterium]